MHHGEFKNDEGRNMNPSVSSVVRILRTYTMKMSVSITLCTSLKLRPPWKRAMSSRTTAEAIARYREYLIADEQTIESHEPQTFCDSRVNERYPIILTACPTWLRLCPCSRAGARASSRP